METGGDCCGDFFYVLVNGDYCVGLVSTSKLVEFLQMAGKTVHLLENYIWQRQQPSQSSIRRPG